MAFSRPMTTDAPVPLAAEFPAATYDDWRALVAAALKGAPFERLIARSYDDLPIEPLIHARRPPNRLPGAWQRSGR